MRHQPIRRNTPEISCAFQNSGKKLKARTTAISRCYVSLVLHREARITVNSTVGQLFTTEYLNYLESDRREITRRPFRRLRRVRVGRFSRNIPGVTRS